MSVFLYTTETTNKSERFLFYPSQYKWCNFSSFYNMFAMILNLLSKANSFLHSLRKRIIRYFTGMSEIERICHPPPHSSDRARKFSSKMTKLFSSALKRSKKILTYRKLIFCNLGSLKPFSVTAALENIIQIKGIKADNTNLLSQGAIQGKLATIGNITHSLCAIRLVNLVAFKFETMRKDTFDKSNKNHLSMLNKLWFALKPECTRISEFESGPTPLISADWGEIGFQGKDPSTDFRGMGLLGLRQLIYFCEKNPDIARNILLISNHPQKYYPFAITGINITAFLLELLNETRLHGLILDNLEKLTLDNTLKYSTESKAFDDVETIACTCDALNDFYCFIFQKFSKLWVARNPKDIMDFPRIFTELKRDIRYNFPEL